MQEPTQNEFAQRAKSIKQQATVAVSIAVGILLVALGAVYLISGNKAPEQTEMSEPAVSTLTLCDTDSEGVPTLHPRGKSGIIASTPESNCTLSAPQRADKLCKTLRNMDLESRNDALYIMGFALASYADDKTVGKLISDMKDCDLS